VSSLQTLIDPAPDPIWHACFRETLANLKAALIPRQRAVVELKLAGLSNSEIASRVGLSVRSVERDLSEVWSMWNELHVSNSDEEHPSMAVRQEKRAVEV
jgi:DNA-binding NarL/FixJ family response regulator